jgi:hypothetical protein
VDLERYLLELVGVLLAVVGAEEKVEPAGQGDSDICLRAASVATIRGVQGGTFDDGVFTVASLPGDSMSYQMIVSVLRRLS